MESERRVETTEEMDSSDGIGVYGEAKAEYTRQLCIFLIPALEGYFLDLLKDVKETEKDSRRVLWNYQDRLKQFPDWNMDKVQKETEKVIAATNCDYLEEILTAVFIAHTKVLSAIRLTSKQKKLQITIPKLEHFLHRTMSACARLLWSNAYLFSETASSIEKQKNLRQVEQLLEEAILQSIRSMLPVKSILREYLNDDDEADGSSSAAVEDTVPPVVPETAAAAEAEAIPVPVVDPVVEPTPVPVAVPAVSEQTPVPAVEAVPEPTPAPVADPVSEPRTPTIVVDTEPAVVSFTALDAILDTDNPEQTTIRMASENEDDDDDVPNTISYNMNEKPEEVDDFEDLEKDVAFEEDEFEKLE
jgi:hypothetical protein